MWKQCTCLTLLIMLLALVSGGSAFGAAFNPLKDPAIVGWWTCDDGTGTTVADASPNGRDGTAYSGLGGAAAVGTLTWVPGMYGGAVELKSPNLIQIPAVNITMTAATMAGWMKPLGTQAAWTSFMMTRGSATGLNINPDAGNLQLCYHWGDAASSWGYRPNAYLVNNEWNFAAVTISPTAAIFYLNGVEAGTNTAAHGAVNWNAAIFLGGDGSGSQDARRMTDGLLDDVSLFSRTLTADEVKSIMQGLTNPALAGTPTPDDGATDVPQDAAFAWKPGETAATHNIYIGTSFVDVNAASVADPRAVLAGQGLTETAFASAAKEFGQTYYWRVDEVEAGGTVLKGNVWSFTAETYAYPITGVTATASSFQPGMSPTNTVNGSGLNANDQHGVEPVQMWMTNGAKPAWIQFEFAKVEKLHEMWVWNSNQLIEAFIGFGAKNVTVEYSTDGATWATLADVPEFAKATASATYAANTVVPFGGVQAKYVKLTINANWGGVAPQTGLAEVRFFQIPAQARIPVPADDATNVTLDSQMNWRPGRDSTSHKVFFGVDANAVAAGTVAASTVTEHSFAPAAMQFGTEYFWKVNEIGDTGTYEGNVWSFVSQEFAPIDDFEAYNDDDNRIYDSWIDGVTTQASGSQVGYMDAPFAERKTVHTGRQSMPLAYDNSGSFSVSEAELAFDTAQNWTTNGADSVVVWFRGQAPGFAEMASGNIVMSAIGADIWNNADEFRYAYKTLNGDGTMIARVESIINSNVWAKGGVMIRQSVEASSMHAFMPITPGGSGAGNGASFQHRLLVTGASTNNDNTGAAVAAPYWVKIERKGNAFSGYISPDGKTWTQLGTAQTITMTGPVLIGLALCSHDAAVSTAAEFSNISTTGNVTGNWTVADIGVEQPKGNSGEGLYLSVKDSAGKTKIVQNSNAMASATTAWQQWKIPLSEFTSAGVKMNAVKSLVIGVGNKAAPVKGGTGMVFIDDIGYGRSAAGQ